MSSRDDQVCPQERFGSRRLGRGAFSDAVCTAIRNAPELSACWSRLGIRLRSSDGPESHPEAELAARKFLFDLAIKSDFLFWAATRVAPRAMRLVMLATPPEDIAHVSVEEGARAARVLEHTQPLSSRRLGLLSDAAVTLFLPRYEFGADYRTHAGSGYGGGSARNRGRRPLHSRAHSGRPLDELTQPGHRPFAHGCRDFRLRPSSPRQHNPGGSTPSERI
jgi:hypothetical protein